MERRESVPQTSLSKYNTTVKSPKSKNKREEAKKKDIRDYSYTASFDRNYPYISNLKYCSDDFKDRKVIVLEKIKGFHIRFFFDGKLMFLGSKTEIFKKNENPFNLKEIYTSEYASGFLKLIDKLNHVPFTIFGEFMSEDTENGIIYLKEPKKPKIVFYDLYLNSNWMNWDDFLNLMKKSNFIIPPMLYRKVFDKEKIEKILEIKSPFSQLDNQPIGGIIVRPSMEDSKNGYGNDRRIAKLESLEFSSKEFPAKTSKALVPVYAATVPREKLKPHASMIAHRLVKKFCNKETMEIYWNYFLEEEGLEYTKENEGRVIGVLIKETIDFLKDDIVIEAANNALRAREIRKEIGRILPGKILRIIGPINGK